MIHRIQPKWFFILMSFWLIGTSAFAKSPADECEELFKSGLIATQNKEYRKALEYFTKGEILASEHQFYEKVYFAKNNIGILYYNLNDYGEALNHYLDAYTVVIKHLGPVQEMTVLNNIAILYSEEEEYEKAEAYFLKAYQIAQKEKDNVKIAHYAINLGILCSRKNDFIAGEAYYLEALELLEKPKEKFILSAEIGLSKIYLGQKRLEEAKKILDRIYKKAKISNFQDQYCTILMHLSEYYFQQKNYAKAKQFCDEVSHCKLTLNDQIGMFEMYSKIFFETKEFDLALKYKDSIVKTKDSIHQLKNSRLYENNKVKFELQNYIQEINYNKAQLRFQRWIFLIAILILLSLIFLVYKLYQSKAVKEAQKKSIALREQQILALELEKQQQEHLILEKQLKSVETQSLLEQEQFKSEIEQKNRQLSAKALYLSGRNEIIEDVIKTMSSFPEISANKALKNAIQRLKENIQTDQHWDSFMLHFEEVNQGLLSKLKDKHVDLNANDIRFICYVYMNLSTKEICTVFNITQEACRKRKERISKKMGLTDGESLYEYLSKIDK